MRVFIAGATGVLGRRVVRRLRESGQVVIGLSRSKANSEWLSKNGAEPRSGDLFDQDAIFSLTSDCDAILHLATSIPTKSRTTLADWEMNDRIRREGTRVLVGAAIHNHCQLYVQESVTFIYGDRNGEWVDESARIPDRQPRILRSAREMEGVVQDAIARHNLPAIIVRFGSFYSHDSPQTQAMFQLARRGFLPIVGDGLDYWNVINVDDAAEAVVKAVENHEAGAARIFNVCDDEPVQYRELVSFIAESLGARKPIHIPRVLARLMLGSHVVDAIFSSVRCRNERIKEALGWVPRFPTYREGYPAEIERWLHS